MGIHVCSFCQKAGSFGKTREMEFEPFGTGDAAIRFASGRVWLFPEMLPHYVAEHRFQPPAEFVDDVMHSEVRGGGFDQGSQVSLREVGYLTGPDFPRGEVPDGFANRLFTLIEQARQTPGWFRQSK